ncbi:MAG: hypothetical protein IJ599_01535 [Alphaproteobacteria bacterium]|nr:hypothetical protein [Alphaproteobacteria bacterium]
MSKMVWFNILLCEFAVVFNADSSVSVEDAMKSSNVVELGDICNTIMLYDVGKLLIKQINEYFLQMPDVKLKFEKSDTRTEFDCNDGKNLRIFINPNDLKSCPTEGVSEQVFEISGTTCKVRLVETTENSAPDEVIVHELIHLKHFVEEKHKIATNSSRPQVGKVRDLDYFMRIAYSEATSMGYCHISTEERKLFPELEAEKATDSRPYGKKFFPLTGKWPRRALWASFEERRTVCGPDLNGITENAYRKAKNRPPRFIYQGKYVNFFEPVDVIKRSTGSEFADKNIKYNTGKTETNFDYTLSSIRTKIYDFMGKIKTEVLTEIK